MKPIWWIQKQSDSELELHQQRTRRENVVFGWNHSVQPPHHTRQKNGKKQIEQPKPIPILSTCLEFENNDSFTSDLKNVIPPRHSNLRLIRDLKNKSNESIYLMIIPPSLLKIGKDAFYQSQLKSLIFARNAKISFADKYAFSQTENLHSIQIPRRSNSLGKAFFTTHTSNRLHFQPKPN